MQHSKEQILSGARKILLECLALQQGDDILIFCDEMTVEATAFLAQAARELGIDHVAMFEPTSLQPQHDHREDFAWSVKGIIDRTGAILNCLNNRVECLPFRKRIIHHGRGVSRRIGHMPGASTLLLAVSDADYDRIQTDCFNLALPLAKGKHIHITTRDATDKEYVLEADIGGWDQIPVASDGTIPRGAWGNIPGGETYITPVLGTASGGIVINVAFPNVPLYQPEHTHRLWQEEAVLQFDEGRLVSCQTNSEAISQVLEYERQLAESQGDSNWRNLAEIGIGVNRSIRGATGISLVDEKMYGSMHIAIGDNISLGGTNESVVHCDMVTFAEVEADGRVLLRDGEICANVGEWLEHFSQVHVEESLREGSSVRFSGGECVEEKGALYKVLDGGAGRLLNVPVGDPETARLASQVLQLLPADRRYTAVQSLIGRSPIPEPVLFQIVQLLCNYRLADIRQCHFRDSESVEGEP